VSQHAATGGGSASDGAGSAAAGAKGEAGNVMSSSSSPSSSPLVWGSESNLVAVRTFEEAPTFLSHSTC